MPDRHLPDPAPGQHEAPPPDRDGRVESLLLTGLDYYFAGEYERAISAWTRVLFLDHGHPRAKAYIDRARGAVAERQRQSEELLHQGVDAFNRGETANARALLLSAVEHGGPHEVALAFLQRLERLDQPAGPVDALVDPPRRRHASPAPGSSCERRRARRWQLPLLILALVGAGVLYILASSERVAPLRFLVQGSDQAAPGTRAAAPGDEPLPVPRAAELDLQRARVLLASGHARDALRLVEQVRPDDPLRAQADQLRGHIQAALLSAMQPAPTAAPVRGGSRRP